MTSQAGSHVSEVAAVLLTVPVLICASEIMLCSFITQGRSAKHSKHRLWQFCVIVLPTLEALLGASAKLYAAIAFVCITTVLIDTGNTRLLKNNKELAQSTLLGSIAARKRCDSVTCVHF